MASFELNVSEADNRNSVHPRWSVPQAVFMLVALGWVFAPVYRWAGVTTTPEYLGRRFGSDGVRLAAAALDLPAALRRNQDLGKTKTGEWHSRLRSSQVDFCAAALFMRLELFAPSAAVDGN